MYPILALIGLMLLTWGATIWASFMEEDPLASSPPVPKKLRKNI
jgi:hypothetical protein